MCVKLCLSLFLSTHQLIKIHYITYITLWDIGPLKNGQILFREKIKKIFMFQYNHHMNWGRLISEPIIYQHLYQRLVFTGFSHCKLAYTKVSSLIGKTKFMTSCMMCMCQILKYI